MRAPNRIQHPYGIDDLYKFYISDKEPDSPYIIEKSLYKIIVKEYINAIFEKIYDGSIYYMPFAFGPLYVNKRKIILGKRLSPDWEATKKFGKLIFHLNEHTNGYKYSFKWDKGGCKVRNSRLYRLEMARINKRTLAKSIKQDGKDYIADKV